MGRLGLYARGAVSVGLVIVMASTCSSGDNSAANSPTSISGQSNTTVATDPAALVRRIVQRISADPAQSAAIDPAVGRELGLVQLRAIGMTEAQAACVATASAKVQPTPPNVTVGTGSQQTPALDPSVLIPCIGIEGMSKLAATPPDLASVPIEQLRGLFDAVVRGSLTAGGFAPAEVDCVASRVVTPADDAARAKLLTGTLDPSLVEADIGGCLSPQRLSELAR